MQHAFSPAKNVLNNEGLNIDANVALTNVTESKIADVLNPFEL